MDMIKKTSKFLRDLEVGEAGERKVAAALKSLKKATAVLFPKMGKDYDFVLEFDNAPRITVETKTDLFSKTSSNIFMEVSCNGMKSGLTATKAAIWVFYLPHLEEGLAFCPIKMLKYLLSDAGRTHRVVNGGDGWRVKGHLVPIDVTKKLPFVEIIAIKDDE